MVQKSGTHRTHADKRNQSDVLFLKCFIYYCWNIAFEFSLFVFFYIQEKWEKVTNIDINVLPCISLKTYSQLGVWCSSMYITEDWKPAWCVMFSYADRCVHLEHGKSALDAGHFLGRQTECVQHFKVPWTDNWTLHLTSMYASLGVCFISPWLAWSRWPRTILVGWALNTNN